MKTSSIDILMAGTRSCTGSCVYCASANQKDVYRSSILQQTANKTYDEVQFDFDKLEETLKNYNRFIKADRVRFIIWGADPLSSFYALQDTVDFLNYMADKYNKQIEISTSTNGLPIQDDRVVDYLNDNKIKLQLSHDGVAEELRLPIDPLVEYQENFARLYFVFINCVAHGYNTDFTANIEYFNKWAIKWTRNIRFSKPMLGANWSNTINKNGFKNGKYYDELKGKPFGDFGIHEEDIDKYIFDFLHLPKPYRCNLPVDDINFFKQPLNNCGKYATKQADVSSHIDTLGNFTVCNLVDSFGQLGNPTMKQQFDECSTCIWNKSSVCTGCCINEPESTVHDKCIFNRKLNEAIASHISSDRNK